MRVRMLRDYPTDTPGQRVRVTVQYSRGMGDARGYWLHIYPCRIEGDFAFMTMGQGGKMLLAPAKRFSEKGLADAAWQAEGLLVRDDPAVRQQIAACGTVEDVSHVPNV